MRIDTLALSVSLMLRAIAVSIWKRPGARTRALPALSHVPLAGVEKAAGLIQPLMVCPPGGISGTPGTGFGRWFAFWPSGMSVVLRETVSVKGSPLRTE